MGVWSKKLPELSGQNIENKSVPHESEDHPAQRLLQWTIPDHLISALLGALLARSDTSKLLISSTVLNEGQQDEESPSNPTALVEDMPDHCRKASQTGPDGSLSNIW